MKIYIASHCQKLAKILRGKLEENGHTLTSRWIESPFERTETFSEQARTKTADGNFSDIRECDALVLITGPDRYAGGKFVEAGYALGIGKKVFVYGRRENMQMWASEFVDFDLCKI